MLGVGGAAAVARDQELVAAAQGRRDGFGNFARHREQAGVEACALKRLARKRQMRGNRVFWSRAQASPSMLDSSLVMIGRKLCKLTSSLTRSASDQLHHLFS